MRTLLQKYTGGWHLHEVEQFDSLCSSVSNFYPNNSGTSPGELLKVIVEPFAVLLLRLLCYFDYQIELFNRVEFNLAQSFQRLVFLTIICGANDFVLYLLESDLSSLALLVQQVKDLSVIKHHQRNFHLRPPQSLHIGTPSGLTLAEVDSRRQLSLVIDNFFQSKIRNIDFIIDCLERQKASKVLDFSSTFWVCTLAQIRQVCYVLAFA
jgi:hypothetical protein